MGNDSRTGESGGLGELGPVLLGLAPEIGRWAFGTGSEQTVAAMKAAVAAVTGSADPSQQGQALADSSISSALRVVLAQLAAQREDEVGERDRAALIASVAEAARGTATLMGAERQLAWGAPVISLVVLLTFGGVMVVALTRAMPPGAEPVLNVLMGTLGAMATSVVGYWVGSSAGSARKDERLATLVGRG